MKTHSPRNPSPATGRPPEADAVPLAQVAHGLNNTLTVITGFSELLLGVMSECDPHHRYVEEIQRVGRPPPPPARKSRPNRALRELAHAHLGHETILLVEDDEAVRDAVMHELVVLGYTVFEASDGPEALCIAAALPKRRIDLLLTDVVMPVMDGCTLATRLRQSRPGLKVIFSSGYTREAVLWQSPRPSGDGFLPKPFTASQLLETVAEALRRAGHDPAHIRVSFPASAEPHSHWGLNE